MKSDGTSVVRTKRKEVQYSEKELTMVKEKAAKAGLTPSEYIRQASLNVKLTEALSVKDRERIERANSIPYKMQVNLNQIAKLGHTNGVASIRDAVLEFIRSFDTYVETGTYEPIDISHFESYKREQVRMGRQDKELILLKNEFDKTLDELEKAKAAVLKYWLFTREGEDAFKKQCDCTLYPDNAGYQWFFKVGDNMARKLPSGIINKYIDRRISIEDVYKFCKSQ